MKWLYRLCLRIRDEAVLELAREDFDRIIHQAHDDPYFAPDDQWAIIVAGVLNRETNSVRRSIRRLAQMNKFPWQGMQND